jgi:hypothetical protein
MSSPNPGGRPKALHDVEELARHHTEAAIDTLAKVIQRAPERVVLGRAGASANIFTSLLRHRTVAAKIN